MQEFSMGEEGYLMVRLTVLAVSSVLVLSTAPVYAQPAGPFPPEAGPPVVYHEHDWRAHEPERAYRHERHRLKAEQRDIEAHRRAMHAQHKFEEGNGFYGR
jgi:hypothetical protein